MNKWTESNFTFTNKVQVNCFLNKIYIGIHDLDLTSLDTYLDIEKSTEFFYPILQAIRKIDTLNKFLKLILIKKINSFQNLPSSLQLAHWIASQMLKSFWPRLNNLIHYY